MSQIKSLSKIWSVFFSNPARVIVSSFALMIFTGTLLLMLPISIRSGESTNFLEALFTATSATCVTGLTIRDTYTYFSTFGQVIIIFLIQLGGLGLVTFATFFNIALHKRMGLKTLYIAQESTNSDSMHNIGRLIKIIFATTFLFEITGALVLMGVFIPKYGSHGIFISIFLAISAYCNAGFDILGFEGQFTSLSNYYNNPVVLITIIALVICGGLGFIVWQDIYHIKKRKHLTLHSKIVLFSTLILIISGMILFGICEWNNSKTLGNMGVGEKILNSFFMSVTTRTAGFETIPSNSTFGITKLVTCFLMFIGAAPGSTGGGIKITTAYVLFMTVICVMRGNNDTIIDKHKIDKSVVYKALAVASMAWLIVGISSATIFFSTHSGGIKFSEINALFESVSAFGTVGLSSGVSVLSNTISRVILILTMFTGRVGPLSLALSLAMRPQNKNTVMPDAKIMVG